MKTAIRYFAMIPAWILGNSMRPFLPPWHPWKKAGSRLTLHSWVGYGTRFVLWWGLMIWLNMGLLVWLFLK